MSVLTFQRYQFNLIALDSLHLSFYSGSMLRGAFGHALRHLSCVTKMDNCQQCMLYRTCAYPAIFESPPPPEHKLQNFSQIPAPYVIEPPALGRKDFKAGDGVTFTMVLMGNAIAQLPLIIAAWEKAFEKGLSRTFSRAKLINVVQEGDGKIVYQKFTNAILDETVPIQMTSCSLAEKVTLDLETPLRIKKRGQLVAEDLTARDLVMSLVRRYFLLMEFHTDDYDPPDYSKFATEAEKLTITGSLNWCDWSRYSSRQKQKMTLGGVLGQLTLEGPLQLFSTVLVAGQWIHAGTKTSFGLGRYKIIEGNS